MTDAHDWARGKPRKRIDPEVCKRYRISEDRVWVVGLLMALDLDASPFRLVWTSNNTIAKKLGCHASEVNNALSVLKECGLLVPVDPASYSFWDFRKGSMSTLPDDTIKRIRSSRTVVYKAGWTDSKDRRARHTERSHCEAILDRVEQLRESCREAGSGLYRTLRVSFMGVLLRTWETAKLAAVSTLSIRAINKAKRVAGRPIGIPTRIARIKRKRPESPDNKYIHTSTTTRTNFVSSIRSGASRIPLPTQRSTSMGDWPQDLRHNNTSPSTRQKSSPNSYLRNKKPLDQWTALDSAKEFRDRYTKMYSRLPGETGNVVTLAKILGKMRKDFGHGAEVEMATLELWLADSDDIRRNTHIAAYRKWLSSFQRLRPLVEEKLAAENSMYAKQHTSSTVVELSDSTSSFVAAWEAEQKASYL